MKFEVETGQVNSMVQSFKESLAQISANRQRMYNAMETLDGMWQGQAHDAFAVQYRSDNEEVVALLKDLEQVAENIAKARQDYDTCEQQVKETIDAIEI